MAQAQGTIVQCIGAVTDIAFPRDAMPRVYDALVLEEDAHIPMSQIICEDEDDVRPFCGLGCLGARHRDRA